jgi:hypothetical protein
MLFDLYDKSHQGTSMSDRFGKPIISLPMAAFADDTNLIGNDDDRSLSTKELVQATQKGFTIWNKLLNATGHFMELEKCACYLSIWSFQEDGYAYTLTPQEHTEQISVEDLNGVTKIIPQLPSDKSQKLLGVMKNPIGNQQDEIQRLKTKSNRLATQINMHAISTKEAKLAYESFYLPAMRYSLAITSINQIDFESIQKTATASMLSALGYNRHMPREVVFCSKLYQGLGMKHLYDIQGMDSTRLLLQEINTTSTTSKMLRCLIEVIQMESGIGQPIFEDNRPLSHIEWGWIPGIRDFLHHINASITNTISPPTLYRQGDSYIMDAPHLSALTRREQILINRCRIYQQVECVSEISTARGDKLNTNWFSNKQRRPSKSKKNWPRQGDPGPEAWKIWEKFLIRAFTNEKGTLKVGLTKWTQIPQRQYATYFSRSSQHLWRHVNEEMWSSHKLIHMGRRSCSFQRQGDGDANIPPSDGIPIDIQLETENTIITGILFELQQPSNESVLQTLMDKVAQEKTLLHEVQFELPEIDIQHEFQSQAYIDIATDGSHDQTSGSLSYGWVITINDEIMAKGLGPAAAHPKLAGSFRAEAYGLASAATFLNITINHFSVQPTDHIWHFYLDCKTLIDKIELFRTAMFLPKWNLSPDADIVLRAHTLLEMIPATFVHVKGHYDATKSNRQPSRQEQLNSIADSLAAQQGEKNLGPITDIPSSFCQLKINDMFITKDSHKWLMEAATKIPVKKFYSDKYGWSQDTFDSIDWETQYKTLLSFDTNDQRRILKLAHGWLPTFDRMHRELQSTTKRCPLCYYIIESNIHLLACKHTTQVDTIQGLQKYFAEDSAGQNQLTTIVQAALKNAIENPTWTPAPTEDDELNLCLRAQSKIGWQHFFLGRIAKAIPRFVDRHFEMLHNNGKQRQGEKWLRKTIRKIWETYLQLWKQRNEIVHGIQEGDKQTSHQIRLTARLERCYQYQAHLNVNDRNKIFYKSIEAMQKEEPRLIQSWLRICERIIRVHKKEINKPNKSKTMMEQYLQWRPPQQANNRNKKARTRHHKQDLRPD